MAPVCLYHREGSSLQQGSLQIHLMLVVLIVRGRGKKGKERGREEYCSKNMSLLKTIQRENVICLTPKLVNHRLY